MPLQSPNRFPRTTRATRSTAEIAAAAYAQKNAGNSIASKPPSFASEYPSASSKPNTSRNSSGAVAMIAPTIAAIFFHRDAVPVAHTSAR